MITRTLRSRVIALAGVGVFVSAGAFSLLSRQSLLALDDILREERVRTGAAAGAAIAPRPRRPTSRPSKARSPRRARSRRPRRRGCSGWPTASATWTPPARPPRASPTEIGRRLEHAGARRGDPAGRRRPDVPSSRPSRGNPTGPPTRWPSSPTGAGGGAVSRGGRASSPPGRRACGSGSRPAPRWRSTPAGRRRRVGSVPGSPWTLVRLPARAGRRSRRDLPVAIAVVRADARRARRADGVGHRAQRPAPPARPHARRRADRRGGLLAADRRRRRRDRPARARRWSTCAASCGSRATPRRARTPSSSAASKSGPRSSSGCVRKLISAQEEERRRVARELHDETSQILTALGLALHAGRRQSASELVDRLHDGVHRLIVNLRPPALDDLGLAAPSRVSPDVQLRRARHRRRCELAELQDARMDPAMEIAALPHRAGSHPQHRPPRGRHEPSCCRAASTATGLWIEIEDDGRGFEPAAVQRRQRYAARHRPPRDARTRRAARRPPDDRQRPRAGHARQDRRRRRARGRRGRHERDPGPDGRRPRDRARRHPRAPRAGAGHDGRRRSRERPGRDRPGAIPVAGRHPDGHRDARSRRAGGDRRNPQGPARRADL